MSIIGQRILRTEDPALLRGEGTFIDNIAIDDVAHVVYVRSPIAHARLSVLDISAAQAMDGVLGVFVEADLELAPMPLDMAALPAGFTRYLLAKGVVRFVGEPVVAVVATSASAATDAAELVDIDYAALPAVIDPQTARDGEIVLFPEVGSNVCATIDAVTQADFAACEVVVEGVFINQRLAPSPLEARVAMSRWEPDGRLTHWQACQGAHGIRHGLCQVYGLPAAQVRVITPDVGGGFGAKAWVFPEDLLLPFLARRVGRAVRYTETRTESMNGLVHGRAQRQRVRVGGSRDGKVTAYHLDVLQDAGAYPRFGAMLPHMTRLMLTGTYAISNASMSSISVVTNTVPVSAYRGAGRPEAAAAIERAMDLFAAEIGLDPVEVRRRNLVPADQFPYRTATGTVYDSGNYEGALDALLAAVDYGALRTEQARRRAAGDVVQIGIGVAVYVEVTASSGGEELGQVLVEAGPDGQAKVTVFTGTTPFGQGHRTTWAMLAAERLGVALESITVVHGDTDVIERGGITGGSRSVQLGGTNIQRAAGYVVEQAKQVAAEMLEANPADVVMDGGGFHVVGTPALSFTWSQVAAVAGERGQRLFAEGDFQQRGGTFPSGAHLAVVEVDTETGAVRLRQLVAVDDAGTIINPLLAEGQVHGGLAQGIAQALFEEFVYDEHGNPLTGNFADYGIPSAAEMPSFQTVQFETPSPSNDLGSKGIGESGTIGATPAVHNAVCDALGHLGVRHVDMPCTAQRVWQAIRAAASATVVE